ncbi:MULTISPECIES: hypothetical protein [Methylotenera]|uniref:hypothetical protein n=1 Tax=Methylotenera TaxID=359407 RepID=UPI00035D2C8E|nr:MULTISPECIES: hypothetical protein [Methylotenera]
MNDAIASEIEIRIRSTIDYFLRENIPISVSRICTYAEVSRANLYTTYPHLIKNIKSFKTVRSKPRAFSSQSNLDSLKLENKKLKSHVKLLSYTCIELKTALDEEIEKTRILQSELNRLSDKRIRKN